MKMTLTYSEIVREAMRRFPHSDSRARDFISSYMGLRHKEHGRAKERDYGCGRRSRARSYGKRKNQK